MGVFTPKSTQDQHANVSCVALSLTWGSAQPLSSVKSKALWCYQHLAELQAQVDTGSACNFAALPCHGDSVRQPSTWVFDCYTTHARQWDVPALPLASSMCQWIVQYVQAVACTHELGCLNIFMPRIAWLCMAALDPHHCTFEGHFPSALIQSTTLRSNASREG